MATVSADGTPKLVQYQVIVGNSKLGRPVNNGIGLSRPVPGRIDLLTLPSLLISAAYSTIKVFGLDSLFGYVAEPGI